MSHYHDPSLTPIEFARQQRRLATESARMVWGWLRDRRVFGHKFRREHPIPPYTADFCCPALRIVIEIDGEPHLTPERQQRDWQRDQFLQQQGYRILRIRGFDVHRDESSVILQIRNFIKQSPPLPSQGRGAGGEGSNTPAKHNTNAR